MDAGKLDTRILIKRLTKASDGFGGFTSTNATQNTIWANLKFIAGDINQKNGKRNRNLEIELIVRKRTADTILITDLLQIENQTGFYNIKDKYDFELKDYAKIVAVKRN
tara:strand:+ start:193 stop:519 length:327 start_codon:yes stop_codon:yes gene_type:complete